MSGVDIDVARPTRVDEIRRMRHFLSTLSATSAALLIASATAGAQAKPAADTGTVPDLERQAQLARRGGGLRISQWHLNGEPLPTGITATSTPAFEGYVRKGLDLHLVLENSIGIWRQRQVSSGGGSLLGTSATSSDNYVIPQFTSIVLYPMTRPGDRLEPFVRGGVGFALGVQDPQNGSGGVSFTPGFGATGGVGVEWRVSDAFGLAVSGRYNWIRYFQEFAGAQTYQGPAIEAGMTYRFQYR